MLKKIYRNVRLFPRRGREPYVSFYKILHFYPHNLTLYNQALLHKSSSIKLKDGKWINNERLEFLGDAILDAIVADIVYKEFEYKKEGFLTDMRSKIVKRETLNNLALELGLNKLIKTSAQNASAGRKYQPRDFGGSSGYNNEQERIKQLQGQLAKQIQKELTK